MLTFFIVVLTILLILDCLLLGLLILIQLPKKEAGVGVAFGGGTTDALFGAGSGNALSNLTKYTAFAFFILVFALSVCNNRLPRASTSELKEQLELQSGPAKVAPVVPVPTTKQITTNAAAIPLSITSNSVAPVSSLKTNAPAK